MTTSDVFLKYLRDLNTFVAIKDKESRDHSLGRSKSHGQARYKPLQSQFKKAATLIAARAERQAERDFFFVEDGGWDAHSGVEDSLYKKHRGSRKWWEGVGNRSSGPQFVPLLEREFRKHETKVPKS